MGRCFPGGYGGVSGPGLDTSRIGGREGGREGKASELLESLGGCLFRVLTGLDRRRFDITS